MISFADMQEGNLIHLNGPGLIPVKLINSFRAAIDSNSSPEDARKVLWTRFENDYQEFPAYLWECNGDAFSFFVYSKQNDKIDILWCHQLRALFPVETYLRPAAIALVEALQQDLGATRIISQFSSWNALVGVDLLSTVLPELSFKRFDVEIMDSQISGANDLKLEELPGSLKCTSWDLGRSDKAAALMSAVGDSFIKYARLSGEECRGFIDRVFDPGMSRMIIDENGQLIAFINFNRRGWIGQIFTRADYQGRGLGKHLLTLAFRMLSEKNVQKASLAVLADNLRAQKLYRGFGFKSVSSSPLWAWCAYPGAG